MPLPGSWLDDEAPDGEAFRVARKILYSGCPLCLNEQDVCGLCVKFKLERMKPEENRWATTDPRDHLPVPSPSKLSAGRIQFLEATGYVFKDSQGKPSKPKKAINKRTRTKATQCTGKTKLATNKHKPKKGKETLTLQSSTHGKKGMASDKKSPSKFTSQGYPFASSEWELSEQKLIYRPPGYGPPMKSIEAITTKHCTSCHLRPCLAKTMDKELNQMCLHLIESEKKRCKFTIKSLEKTLQKEQCRLFMNRYRLKDPIMKCFQVAAFKIVNKHYMTGMKSPDDPHNAESTEERHDAVEDKENRTKDNGTGTPLPQSHKSTESLSKSSPPAQDDHSDYCDDYSDEEEIELLTPIFNTRLSRQSKNGEANPKANRVSIESYSECSNNQPNRSEAHDSPVSSDEEMEFTMFSD